MISLIYVKATPHYLYEDGTLLPIMAGGQDYPPPPIIEEEETVEGQSAPTDLFAYTGREYYDLLTGALGRLIWQNAPSTGTRQYRLLLPDGRRVIVASGRTLLDPRTLRLLSIGAIYGTPQERNFSVEARQATGSDLERFGLTTTDGGGIGAAGGDSGITEYEQALLGIRRAEMESEEALARERMAEDRRQALLSAAVNLAESREQSRRGARQIGAGFLGHDPFQLTATLGGTALGPDTQTPYDIFKTQLGAVATQEVPQISPNATIADLESAIQKLSGNQPSVGAVPFGPGFARGGEIEMRRGADGAFASRPGEAPGFLVGDGAGVVPGVTEVVQPTRTGLRIIPLAGRAQAGLTESDTSEALKNLSLEPFVSGFANLRNTLTGGASPGSMDYLSRLGFLSTPNPLSGFQFGRGAGALGSPLSIEKGLRDAQRFGFIGEADVRRLTDLIGFLPNPRNAAAQFSRLNPVEREALLSAYRLAGVTPETFDYLLESAQLRGPGRVPISLSA